ncbi:MAG: allantoinase AllB [Actinomycetota bacterium]|nr:allantoinase AllB [Actinomycetota bacterium]
MTDGLVLRGRRVLTPEGERALDVVVRDGTIVALEPFEAASVGGRVVEVGQDEVLLPGLVDSHVHVNEPGRTEWEGFASATKAAARGGVTTIVDMPLNSIPPTTTVEALEVKQAAASGQTWVDVGFWGGAVPDNLGHLEPLHRAGVFGFKCFLLPSGVDEFPFLGSADLERAMREVAGFDGLLIVHAEDGHSIEQAEPPSGTRYAGFLASRPRQAENLAVAELVELARQTRARVHLLHLSSSDVLPLLRSARLDGVRLSVETCPHYLSFAAEQIPDGATAFKCCPPIREAENREALWAGLAGGDIDLVVSDHSPSTPELKHLDTGDFGTAWGGIASLQVGLPAVWTQAHERGHDLRDVVRWMAEGPAHQTGLQRKGRIAVGADADFCIFAPDETFRVEAAALEHKNAVSAYDGATLRGVVRTTWLHGIPIDIDDQPRGRLLTRGHA